jgi:hypothetical protein
MTPREAAARAACRSRCEGRAHVCDQDAHGACLPAKCSMWDVLWLDLVDDVFAGLTAAGYVVMPIHVPVD